MPNCVYCHKAIVLANEPKLKFTVLGGDFFHSKCYIEAHKMPDIRSFQA